LIPVLEASQQMYFNGVRLTASRPTPNLEDQGFPWNNVDISEQYLVQISGL